MKKFVKTSVIVAHTDVTLVPYNVGANFLPDNTLVVGLPCRGYLADHQDEVGVETEKKLYRLDDASKIGLLHDQVKRLLRIFMKRFVKTSVIVAHTDVTLVPYNVGANFLPDNKLVVGLPCRGYLADHQDEVVVETEKKLYRTALFLRWLTSFNSQTPPYRTVPLSTLR
ncbi:unnamed protein product [Mytilus edulis]|uniref:Uncharacterized protein n=1 Tax=Mytilus edulis TaxID=6550 RepID=A0A8S3TU68_MYTED|nr:unnamed protein product [Mytilus edulis]